MNLRTGRTSSASALPRRKRPRPGMTLLELLLVLALIVMIAALALPAMRGPFDNYQLRKAGDLVRVQWTKARVRAMKTGQIQMFRFVPGTGTFSVAPYLTDQDYLETDLEHSGVGQLGGATGASANVPTGMPGIGPTASAPGMRTDRNGALPEGVVFASGMVKSDARSIQIQQETNGTLATQTGGVEPILFYPDGTTSDASVSLSNSQQMYIRVTIRGLTGTVSVSQLLAQQEWQQIEQAIATSATAP